MISMNRIAIFCLVLITHCLLPGASRGQDTPGTVKFPVSIDSSDSLFRVQDSSRSQITEAMTSSSSSVNVTTTATFPSTGSIKIDDEIVYYTSKTSSSFGGLIRGSAGTSAAGHVSGARIFAPMLAAHHNVLALAIVAAQTKIGSGSSVPANNAALVGTGEGSSSWQVQPALNGSNFTNLNAANVTQDSTHRFTTDAEKTAWNAKQDALGFTPENVANKDTDNSLAANSDTKYASQKAIKSYVDTGLATKQNSLGFTPAPNTRTVNSHPLSADVTVSKSDVGLGNADNTSDANKPVSTATQTALNLKVTANGAVTGATKTKLTYDAKGLVTAGTDATTADIADSADKRYVTDAQRTVIQNTSGTNTGDQDLSGLVPTTRTVNGHALSANVTVTPGDLNLVIGIDVEAFDADLLAIAGLTPSNDDVLQRKAGAWTNRTPAQLKTDLALVKTDVGLGNVDNTRDADKPVSTATQTALDAKVTANGAITGATKTKLTYDAKGLITAGADATTADVADSSDKRYVTDAQRTVIQNTSGTNSGDQDLSGLAPTTRTVNGHALSANVTVSEADLSFTDITTNDVSTTKHGFVPKAPNDATKYLDGTGNFTVPAGGGGGGGGSGAAIFGDGSDGSLVYDGSTTILGMAPSANVYTLTRDIYASSLTVNTGVTIKTANFRIFCTGTVSITGTIKSDGNSATTVSGGAGTGTGTICASGGNGGPGGSNAAGTTGSTASSSGAGGAGGAGGAATNAGGSGGGATQASNSLHGGVTSVRVLGATGPYTGGGGGGGGGSSAATASGGGGGGGAGNVGLFCATVTVNSGGVISANGGNGANGSGSAGNAGGGGGGGGGAVLIVANTYTNGGTVQALGGNGGTGFNAGSNGVNGSAGSVISIQN
jgi:hypothetical protein